MFLTFEGVLSEAVRTVAGNLCRSVKPGGDGTYRKCQETPAEVAKKKRDADPKWQAMVARIEAEKVKAEHWTQEIISSGARSVGFTDDHGNAYAVLNRTHKTEDAPEGDWRLTFFSASPDESGRRWTTPSGHAVFRQLFDAVKTALDMRGYMGMYLAGEMKMQIGVGSKKRMIERLLEATIQKIKGQLGRSVGKGGTGRFVNVSAGAASLMLDAPASLATKVQPLSEDEVRKLALDGTGISEGSIGWPSYPKVTDFSHVPEEARPLVQTLYSSMVGRNDQSGLAKDFVKQHLVFLSDGSVETARSVEHLAGQSLFGIEYGTFRSKGGKGVAGIIEGTPGAVQFDYTDIVTAAQSDPDHRPIMMHTHPIPAAFSMLDHRALGMMTEYVNDWMSSDARISASEIIDSRGTYYKMDYGDVGVDDSDIDVFRHPSMKRKIVAEARSDFDAAVSKKLGRSVHVVPFTPSPKRFPGGKYGSVVDRSDPAKINLAIPEPFFEAEMLRRTSHLMNQEMASRFGWDYTRVHAPGTRFLFGLED